MTNHLGTVILGLLLAMTAYKSSMSAQRQPTTQPPLPQKAIVFEVDELENLSCEQARKAWVAEIKNLQLENQIAKLKGRPQPNRMAIAKLEGKIDEENMLNSQEQSLIKL